MGDRLPKDNEKMCFDSIFFRWILEAIEDKIEREGEKKGPNMDQSNEQSSNRSGSTITVDISQFSLQPGEIQAEWYRLLRNAILDVLDSLGIKLSSDVLGEAFWSPGGDGGTITIFEGDVSKTIEVALSIAASHKQINFEKANVEELGITIGIDHGPLSIRADVDGRPNVWGEAINYSNRSASACDKNQILATERFIELLKVQMIKSRIKEFLGAYQKRLVKHGKFINVYNIYNFDKNIGIPINEDTLIDVADFEAPFLEMRSSYQSHLDEVEKIRSGVWTLLLARRLYDMGAFREDQLKFWVRKVSYHGHIRNPNAPWHPFFFIFWVRCFGRILRARILLQV